MKVLRTQFHFPKIWRNFNDKFFLAKNAKQIMGYALNKRDPVKQEESRKAADAGEDWNQFASICGKLYLWKHKDNLLDIYHEGWRDFARKIFCNLSVP